MSQPVSPSRSVQASSPSNDEDAITVTITKTVAKINRIYFNSDPSITAGIHGTQTYTAQ